MQQRNKYIGSVDKRARETSKPSMKKRKTNFCTQQDCPVHCDRFMRSEDEEQCCGIPDIQDAAFGIPSISEDKQTRAAATPSEYCRLLRNMRDDSSSASKTRSPRGNVQGVGGSVFSNIDNY